MSRPRKCRKIGFIPNIIQFIPEGYSKNNDDAIFMTIEELEVIRLIDLLQLEQTESAEKMGVSRATIQRILSSARKKIADSLINGKKIVIEGGDYKISNCKYVCEKCGNQYLSEGDFNTVCPSCGSDKYKCRTSKEFCRKNCNRYRSE
jgi:predicted DNA-binding protein (UPF0251 family)